MGKGEKDGRFKVMLIPLFQTCERLSVVRALLGRARAVGGGQDAPAVGGAGKEAARAEPEM